MSDERNAFFEPAPADWGRAFAALPLETPDAAAWPRLARAIDRRRRPRWPLWLAAAAVLAMAAVLPWRLWAPDATRSGVAPDAARTARAVPVSTPAADADASPARAIASTDAADPGAIGRETTARAAPRSNDPLASDTQPRIAATADSASADTPDAAPPELERLYAESAQLEALVAMARDGRVATTGAAAAVASRYEAQVAAIDARLVELGAASASQAERLRLWRERVEAMRQLAGFESNQRLLAARGERYDALLVSID